MRDQYKVLSEKYSLITEGLPPLPPLNNGIPWWHLEKTDYWYNYISITRFSGHLVGPDIINWFNEYGLPWAFKYEGYAKYVAGIPVERLVGIGFLDWLRDSIMEDIQNEMEYFSDYYKNEKEELKRVESEAERKVLQILYRQGLKPWLAEQERLRIAALNKDNPGIEMDI